MDFLSRLPALLGTKTGGGGALAIVGAVIDAITTHDYAKAAVLAATGVLAIFARDALLKIEQSIAAVHAKLDAAPSAGSGTSTNGTPRVQT